MLPIPDPFHSPLLPPHVVFEPPIDSRRILIPTIPSLHAVVLVHLFLGLWNCSRGDNGACNVGRCIAVGYEKTGAEKLLVIVPLQPVRIIVAV